MNAMRNAIGLRAMNEADLDFVLAAENDPAHAPFVGRWEREQHMTAMVSEEFTSFVVTDPKGQPVGHVILSDCTDDSRNLCLKRIIITQKGCGFGWAAVKEVQRFAFAKHQARRLWLDVIETNARARSLYQALGFQEEGILREALLHDGEHVSLVIMSMLAREYQAQEAQAQDAEEKHG